MIVRPQGSTVNDRILYTSAVPVCGHDAAAILDSVTVTDSIRILPPHLLPIDESNYPASLRDAVLHRLELKQQKSICKAK